MVHSKYTSEKVKQTGSEELMELLPDGMIGKIKAHFEVSYPYTHRVLSGKQYTDKGIPEAAMRIISFYKEVKVEDKVNQILNSYGPINETRK